MLRKIPTVGLALGAAVAAFALVSPAGHGPPGALLSIPTASAAADRDGGRDECGWWRTPCSDLTDRHDGTSASPYALARSGGESGGYWQDGPSELRGASCEGPGNHFAGGTPVMDSGKSYWDPHPSTRFGPVTGAATTWVASAGSETDSIRDPFPQGRFAAPLRASTGTC